MSNTAMTMPSKIWYGKDPVYGCRDKVWKPHELKRRKEPAGQEWQSITPYIRADIAEELARALESLICGGCDVKAAKALARYRAITP